MSDDINQDLLSELRKLRRANQVGMWLAVVVVTAGLAYVAVLRHDLQRSSRTRAAAQQSQPHPWDEVKAAMDRLDYPKALSLAQAIAARHTNDSYGHAYLGNIYLALDDVTNAEVHYLRAYDLWPDEDNEKSLLTIRKRLANERGGLLSR
jgi:cytochrome c-type biogenesis protein CcmH/NrfG